MEFEAIVMKLNEIREDYAYKSLLFEKLIKCITIFQLILIMLIFHKTHSFLNRSSMFLIILFLIKYMVLLHIEMTCHNRVRIILSCLDETTIEKLKIYYLNEKKAYMQD